LPQYNERSGSDQHGSRNNNAVGVGHLISPPLDAAAQISVFAKLKFANCARPDHCAGRLILPQTSAACRLLLACSPLVIFNRPLHRGIDSKREFEPVGATACKFSCI
jgi:hypothetical protein